MCVPASLGGTKIRSNIYSIEVHMPRARNKGMYWMLKSGLVLEHQLHGQSDFCALHDQGVLLLALA
jgi:hypothetical protein